MSQGSPHVVEVTRETFEREVIERSREVPVLVDFWAAWCGPCRILGPVLERLADDYGGRFVLAKADTEALPEVAAGFGVRSIPAVFALWDGQVVDGFVGAQPEAAIRAFLDRILPSAAERLASEARQKEATDPEAAEARYREALAQDPNEPRARVGLARVRLAGGHPEEARALVAEAERGGYLEPEVEALKAELMLKDQARQAGGVAEARAALAAAPDDLAAQLRLAEALAAAGEHAEALERALDLVERDRRGTGEPARKLMLALFQLLPADSDLVTEYRRRLSFVL